MACPWLPNQGPVEAIVQDGTVFLLEGTSLTFDEYRNPYFQGQGDKPLPRAIYAQVYEAGALTGLQFIHRDALPSHPGRGRRTSTPNSINTLSCRAGQACTPDYQVGSKKRAFPSSSRVCLTMKGRANVCD